MAVTLSEASAVSLSIQNFPPSRLVSFATTVAIKLQHDYLTIGCVQSDTAMSTAITRLACMRQTCRLDMRHTLF